MTKDLLARFIPLRKGGEWGASFVKAKEFTCSLCNDDEEPF